MIPAIAYQLPLAIISEYAVLHKIDRNLVAAIVLKESGGNTWRPRYEPNFKYLVSPRTWAENLGITEETETTLQKMSFGLMQIMGGTARDIGYQGHLQELCEPEIGLQYGCKYLKMLLQREQTVEDAVASYNAGNSRKTPGGLYVKQQYVDDVMRYYREFTRAD